MGSMRDSSNWKNGSENSEMTAGCHNYDEDHTKTSSLLH
jgi:hypothetical protein